MKNILKKFTIFSLMLLCACGNSTQQSTLEGNAFVADPFEPWNRYVFSFNEIVDVYGLEPASDVYQTLLPTVFRRVVKNELDYVALPVTMINSLLQGNKTLILNSFGRFFINTTFGGLGLLDPASDFGLKPHHEDFGQTLAVWGVNDGGYYVAPFLGPLTLRDLGGKFVDTGMSPLTYLGDEALIIQPSITTLGSLEFKSANEKILEGIKSSSPDYYAAIRSFYIQKRNNDIINSDLQQDDKQKPQFIDFNDEQ